MMHAKIDFDIHSLKALDEKYEYKIKLKTYLFDRILELIHLWTYAYV